MNLKAKSCTVVGSSWLCVCLCPAHEKFQKTKNSLVEVNILLWDDCRLLGGEITWIWAAVSLQAGVHVRWWTNKNKKPRRRHIKRERSVRMCLVKITIQKQSKVFTGKHNLLKGVWFLSLNFHFDSPGYSMSCILGEKGLGITNRHSQRGNVHSAKKKKKKTKKKSSGTG